MKTLKVWGGRWLFHTGKVGRCLIAAYTKKQAMELGNVSYSEITNYWSQTYNDVELSIATEAGVWLKEEEWRQDPEAYKRVK